MPSDVLTTPEAAEVLGISLASLRRWCDDGKGPNHWRTPGGQRRFDRADLTEWLKSRQGSSGSDGHRPIG